jgi:hypothetical protein
VTQDESKCFGSYRRKEDIERQTKTRTGIDTIGVLDNYLRIVADMGMRAI